MKPTYLSIILLGLVDGSDVGSEILGQIITLALWNHAADAVPCLVVWEQLLEEALAGHLLHLLFAEVGRFTHEINLKEAHFEMKERPASYRIYRTLDVRLRDLHVTELG